MSRRILARNVALAVLLALAMADAAFAGELPLPYRAHGGGEVLTDLAPLRRYAASQPDLAVGRDFELEYEAGLQKMMARQYEQAVEYLASSCQAAPTHAESALVYSIALLATDRIALAAANLRGAIGLYPGMRDLNIAIGEFLGDQQDYVLARRRLIEKYDRAPGGDVDPDVLALLLFVYYHEGEYQKAQVAGEMLYTRTPGDRVANHYLLGLRQLGQGGAPRTHEQGEAPPGTERRDAPEDPFEQGALLLYAGNNARAAERFAEAIVRDPAHPYAFYELAQALFGLGRHHQAAAVLRRGLDQNGQILDSRLRRRDFYDDPARLDRELEVLQTAIKENTSDPDLLLLLGFQLAFDGQPDRTVMAMRLVDRVSPGDRHARQVLEAVLSWGADRAAPETPGAPPTEAPAETPGESPGESPTETPPTTPGDDGAAPPQDDRQARTIDGVRPTLPPMARDDPIARFQAGDRVGAYFAFVERLLSARRRSTEPATRLREDAVFVLAALEAGKINHALQLTAEVLADRADVGALALDLREFYPTPSAFAPDDLARVISIVEERTLQDPDDLPAATTLGFLLHYSGQPGRARTVFERIAKSAPDDAIAPRFLETATGR